ncbi:MAG: Flp pilus assembly complex ATPase component TadA [Alphaproteobacteria bacterium]|nr:Flp pilus assembly complex ATPase component TadA [Alphaproteobacteria bacterium]MBV8549143.1 Flp pilus assembly complex ATPase component TadA [Alphaproteobacteria bacterium]
MSDMPTSPENENGLQDVNPKHYELALTEQAMRRAGGRYMSLEEILRRNGFAAKTIDRAKRTSNKGDLTMQALRLYVSSSQQTAMGLCLLELREGVLKIAVGDRVDDADLLRITTSLERAHYLVKNVDIEPWDRAELARLMRTQSEMAGERLLRILASLSRDADDALMIEEAVHNILAEALESRTSDIHLSLQQEDARCWIRYRIDGDLVYKHLLPSRVMAPIVTRIKTDAKMDAADRMHPQDGRLAFEWQGRMIDVRCAALPVAPSGEKLTLRLLDRDNLRSFDELFLHAPVVAERLRKNIHGHTKDGGLIVVSGPTGSGKSTTLYGIIQEIDRSSRAVYSVEAPVEYDMPLVDQTSVTDNSANTIADIIRALMRHDPDTIIIGEMRDSDTVEAALRATESGHMVITTVHAVDALHTLDRIDGFLTSAYRTSGLYILGHALIASLSQRLVKTVCPACHKTETAINIFEDANRCADMEIDPDSTLALVSPQGCDLCNNTGFLGRTLLLEAMFPPDDQASRRQITEMMVSNVTTSVVDVPGTIYIPRRQSIIDLIRRSAIDANMGASLLVEEAVTRAGR